MAKSNSTSKVLPATTNRLPRIVRSNSIYGQLRDELRVSVLQAGKPGDRVPSERQLAQQFGVSPITISRALQELQHEGCIERIPSKGTFIARSIEPLVQENLSHEAAMPIASSFSFERQTAPQPNGANSTLHTWIVASLSPGDVGPEITEYWSHRLTSHVERFIQRVGGRTEITNLDMIEPANIAAICERMVDIGINNILFLTDVHRDTLKLWAYEFLRIQSKIAPSPLAITQVGFGNHTRYPFDTVRFNGEQGAFLATSHLISQGHRDIAFISPSLESEWVDDRIRGFCRALEMAGIEVSCGSGLTPNDERIICAAPVSPSSDTWDDWNVAGRDAGAKMLESKRYTAVVAANDAMGLALMELAKERGLKVPDDLSVVGFDDRHSSSTMGLTTIHPPIEAMGDAAAALTIRRLAEPFEQGNNEVVLNPTLVIRSSSRGVS